MTPLNQADMNILQSYAGSGDYVGYYTYLSNKGDPYATLALGVALGNTPSGAAARAFAENVGQITGDKLAISNTEWATISKDLMAADFNTRNAIFSQNGTVSELDFEAISTYHSIVFDTVGLPPEAWTAFIPCTLGNASAAEQQARWEGLLGAADGSVSEWFAAFGVTALTIATLLTGSGNSPDDLLAKLWIEAMLYGPDHTQPSGAIQEFVAGQSQIDPFVIPTENGVLIGGSQQGESIVNANSAAVAVMIGYGGNDNMLGNQQGDTLYGNGGNDTLRGDAGSDALYGDEGSDSLEGGNHTDRLEGGMGNDTLLGGSGNDILDGGSGNDTIYGGEEAGDADRIYVTSGFGQDWVTGGEEIYINNVRLSGNAVDGDRDGVYNLGSYALTHGANGLTVTQDGNSVLLADWVQDGDYGISLVGAPGGPGPNNLPDTIGGGSGQSTVAGSSGNDWMLAAVNTYAQAGQNNFSDPLVLDLDGDGVELANLRGDGVEFDLTGDGIAELAGWVGSDDGLLVRDLNGNGVIDGIAELFGNQSQSGFAMLRAAEAAAGGNVNGIIDAGDGALFASLRIWRDANGDGITNAGELHGLSEYGITSLDARTTSVQADARWIAGNQIIETSRFGTASGGGEIAEVLFQMQGQSSIGTSAGLYSGSAPLFALPQSRGYGDLSSWQDTMAASPAFKTLVQNFAASTDDANYSAQIETILLNWAGVQNVAATARGANVDARHLEFLEEVFGQEFNVGGTRTTPTVREGQLLEQSWETVLQVFTERLLVQGPLKALFPNASYNQNTDHLTLGSSFTALLANAHNSTHADEFSFWLEMRGIFSRHASELGVSQSTIDQEIAEEIGIAVGNGGIVASLVAAFGSHSHIEGDGAVTGSLRDDLITGGHGNDTLQGDPIGGSGSDLLLGGDGNDVLNSYDGVAAASGDSLFGGNGNDTLNVTGAEMLLSGDAGNDGFYGQANHSTAIGGAGDDSFNLIGTNVTILGGDGNDVCSRYYYGSTFGDSLVDLGSGNDIYDDQFALRNTVYGGLGNDTIVAATSGAAIDAGDGNDSIWLLNGGDAGTAHGGAGDDVIQVSRGSYYLQNVQVYGDDGNDIVEIYGQQGTVAIDGGNGVDVLNLNGYYASAASVTLGAGAFVPTQNTSASGFEGYVWSSYHDSVTGNASGNLFYGHDGNDLLSGMDGNDTLYGGRSAEDTLTGDDTLVGGAGSDLLYGNGGHDAIYGGAAAANDTLDASADTLDGGAGDDSLYGGDGNDILSGGSGNNYLRGEAGDDLLVAAAVGNNALYGGGGADRYVVLTGSGGTVTLQDFSISEAGEAIDLRAFTSLTSFSQLSLSTLSGNAQISLPNGQAIVIVGVTAAQLVAGNFLFYEVPGVTVSGGLSGETLNGTISDDSISGGGGNDTVYGLQDTDTLKGDDGNDLIHGGDGQDFLYGNAGDDILYGEADPDFFQGNDGNDSVYGGTGNDTLSGNAGNDYVLAGDSGDSLDGADTVYGGAGIDSLYGAYGNDILYGHYDADLVQGGFGNDVVYGDFATADVLDGNDTLKGESGNDTLYGSGGNDSAAGGTDQDALYGGSGSDTLYGDAGHDFLQGDEGNDSLYGNVGEDSIYGNAGNDYVLAGDSGDSLDGADAVYGGAGIDSLYGAYGNDVIYGQDDADLVQGGVGDDAVYGDFASADALDGNDTLKGESGNDTLYGSGGNDVLNGGGNLDMLSGGGGADSFQYSAVTDSGNGSGNRDMIVDFSHAEGDVIDLSAFSGVFTFRGTSAFTGTTAEIRYTQIGGNTVVAVDANGDAQLDFEIQLTGLQGLASSDFLL